MSYGATAIQCVALPPELGKRKVANAARWLMTPAARQADVERLEVNQNNVAKSGSS